VKPGHAELCAVAGDEAELDIQQLGYVHEAVIVATGRNGCGDDDSSSVDSLEDALEMTLPCYFFDEDGCEAFVAELFVDAEEVDFGGVNDVIPDTQSEGYT